MDLKIQSDAKQKIKRYFNYQQPSQQEFLIKSSPINAILPVFAGLFTITFLVLAIVGFANEIIGLGVVGIILFVIGVITTILLFRSYKKNSTSAENICHEQQKWEVDAKSLERNLTNIFRYALSEEDMFECSLDRLGLSSDEVETISPIYISGYYFGNISNIKSKYKKGMDGLYRSSAYEYTLLLFSEKQLFMFTYRVDVVNDVFDIRTDEYFYEDIVSISTSSEKVVIAEGITRDKDITYDTEEFKMITTGGSIVKCAINTFDEQTQKSITAMKHLLRDKKNNRK